MILIIAVILYTFLDSTSDRSRRNIKVHYVCKLPISPNMDDIGWLQDPFPRLRGTSVLERGVFFSKETASYGYNGIYGSKEYEAIFIYWADEPLGNVVDGYV